MKGGGGRQKHWKWRGGGAGDGFVGFLSLLECRTGTQDRRQTFMFLFHHSSSYLGEKQKRMWVKKEGCLRSLLCETKCNVFLYCFFLMNISSSKLSYQHVFVSLYMFVGERGNRGKSSEAQRQRQRLRLLGLWKEWISLTTAAHSRQLPRQVRGICSQAGPHIRARKKDTQICCPTQHGSVRLLIRNSKWLWTC